jgi:hypothetical protein
MQRIPSELVSRSDAIKALHHHDAILMCDELDGTYDDYKVFAHGEMSLI